jgi:hypothetical protein
VIGRSKLRGPGTQTGLAGAGTGVGILKMPFLAVIGEAMGGGRAMDGGVGQETKRSTSFSARNMLSNFKIWRPVAASSRTGGRAFDNCDSAAIALCHYFVEEGGVASVVRNA